MNLRGNTINETCARKNVSINVQFRPVNIVCVFFLEKNTYLATKTHAAGRDLGFEL